MPPRKHFYCTIPNCNKRHEARGLCPKHYEKFKKYGDPLYVRPRRVPIARPWGNGYMRLRDDGKARLEHKVVVERILGKRLPKGVQVHHIDGNKANNLPSNLVVCPDASYHALIELRTKAYEACGKPDWIKCQYCKQWDDPANMYMREGGRRGCHRKCRQERMNYTRKLKTKKK